MEQNHFQMRMPGPSSQKPWLSKCGREVCLLSGISPLRSHSGGLCLDSHSDRLTFMSRCHDKILWLKHLKGERVYLVCSSRLQPVIAENSRRLKPEAASSVTPSREQWLHVCLLALSSLSLKEFRFPAAGIAPPTVGLSSHNQDNPPQTWPQVSLI